MNPISFSRNLSRVGKTVILAVFVLSLVGTVMAEGLTTALGDICGQARSVLFVGAMLLIVVGAAVYAVGQILGAETRARASVWATAMFVGAIIGILIYILLPPFLETVLGGEDISELCEGAAPAAPAAPAEPGLPGGGGDECVGDGC